MKQDKKQELRNSTVDQLNKRIEKIAEELAKMQLDFTMGKVKNVHSMKVLKNERAFIKTVITEKELDKSAEK